MRARPVVLGAGLAATLAATAWLASSPDDDAVAAVPARRPPSVPATARVAGSGDPDASAPALRARTPWPAPASGAIAAWTPTPPPAPPAPAPAAATRAASPAFPYRWIGRLDAGDGDQALLAGPMRSFGARAGEVLDGHWRIESIGATRLELTWLPSGDTVRVEARR